LWTSPLTLIFSLLAIRPPIVRVLAVRAASPTGGRKQIERENNLAQREFRPFLESLQVTLRENETRIFPCP
jgi:hypothetical protein